MAVRIKLATEAEELDALFRIRHQVYAEEEGYMAASPEGRIFDRFDAFPTAQNLIAIVDGRVVGGVRLVGDGPAGTPADSFFDFRSKVGEGVWGSAGMLCLSQAQRPIRRVSFALMAMLYYAAEVRGMTHLWAPANPDQMPMFERMGWRQLAPQFYHEEHKLQVIPMTLEIERLHDNFLRFLDKQGLRTFLHAFERQFHVAGETVVRQGDVGKSAYVVVDGEVEVVREGSHDERIPLGKLGPGLLFGELALLTDQPRTATISAATDLDLMVLDRAALEAAINTSPTATRELLRLLGNRLAGVLDRLDD